MNPMIGRYGIQIFKDFCGTNFESLQRKIDIILLFSILQIFHTKDNRTLIYRMPISSF